MMPLPEMNCPVCASLMISEEQRAGIRSQVASNYNTCLRKCHQCQLGYSNAEAQPVRIYDDPLANIPIEFRSGAMETLRNALNVKNRSSKAVKFGFETSEDAVSWTVFRFLQSAGLLQSAFRQCGINPAPHTTREPAVLLWGCPVPLEDQRAKAIRGDLVRISEELNEVKLRRSEPDVILDFGESGLIIVEVKYRSPNEVKPATYRGWNKYLHGPAFTDTVGIRKSGLYELARYWRIGWELARERPFFLVNLGKPALFSDTKGNLALFQKSLRSSEKRGFRALSWPELLTGIQEPAWFVEYILSRVLKIDATPRRSSSKFPLREDVA